MYPSVIFDRVAFNASSIALHMLLSPPSISFFHRLYHDNDRGPHRELLQILMLENNSILIGYEPGTQSVKEDFCGILCLCQLRLAG